MSDTSEPELPPGVRRIIRETMLDRLGEPTEDIDSAYSIEIEWEGDDGEVHRTYQVRT